MVSTDFGQQIGLRVKHYRTRLKMSQLELAKAVGFSSPQIVSQIETGERELKARELTKVADVLVTSVQNLLSQEIPEIVVPKWRDRPSSNFEKVEARFCLRCERLALLEEWSEDRSWRELPKISLPKDRVPQVNDVARAAEDIRVSMQLGGRPAASLQEILEEDYGVKIFHDSFEGSALCVSGKFGRAILLNRDNVKWRRNFSLAHELFHLLLVEDGYVYEDGQLEERHAQVFASSLLLPNNSVLSLLDSKAANGKIPMRDLVSAAQEFHVSSEALLWRLCRLGRMKREKVQELVDSGSLQKFESLGVRKNDSPNELPNRFVRLALLAYSKGRIGTTKLAQFLETTVPELKAESKIWNVDVALDEEAEVTFA